MTEQEDIVLDSLPYADTDLDLELANDLVQKELQMTNNEIDIPDLEMFQDYPELKELLEMASQRIKLNAIDTKRFMLPGAELGDWKAAEVNAKVQLEYQENRQIDLELMNKFGANSWKSHNELLEKMIEDMQKELEQVNEKITNVNKQRKQDQLFTQTSLRSMKQKQNELLERTEQISIANEKLEKELH